MWTRSVMLTNPLGSQKMGLESKQQSIRGNSKKGSSPQHFGWVKSYLHIQPMAGVSTSLLVARNTTKLRQSPAVPVGIMSHGTEPSRSIMLIKRCCNKDWWSSLLKKKSVMGFYWKLMFIPSPFTFPLQNEEGPAQYEAALLNALAGWSLTTF